MRQPLPMASLDHPVWDKMGQTMGNQRQLWPDFYRNMSSPQHPGSSCCTQQADLVPSQQSAGCGEVDSVFISLMLDVHGKSKVH